MTTVEKIVVPGDEPFEALIALPDSASGPLPGVLLIHDITGAEPDIERNLRIIADRGYVALAPLLFTVGGRRRLTCVVSALGSLSTRRGRSFEVIERARIALAETPSCTGDVAVTGSATHPRPPPGSFDRTLMVSSWTFSGSPPA